VAPCRGPAGWPPRRARRHAASASWQGRRTRPEPDPTGVDHLGLVAAAHDEEAGTGAKIDFTQLGKLTGSDPGQEEER